LRTDFATLARSLTGLSLAASWLVDRGVIATATELYEARHFPGVVAMVTDALEAEPECVPLLLIRARAHIQLRRDLDAQADLRDIIRLDPQCGPAFRLLGELAARRDENESAAIFFRESLRLDPTDREASEWLAIVDSTLRPAAAARKLASPVRGPVARAATGADRQDRQATRSLASRNLARGTRPPGEMYEDDTDKQATVNFARGSQPPEAAVWKTPTPMPVGLTMPGQMPPRPLSRGPTPELPGFGEYLVASGILTRERLRAAQAYQRSMKVQLSTAIVTLGLATPQRIEWAAVAHQSQLARERDQ